MTWTTPRTWESLENLGASDLNVELRDNLEHLYANLPTRAVMWHDEATVTTGNALAYTVNANQIYSGFAAQSASADGDTFTHGAMIAEGTYTLSILGSESTASGIIDWYMDDVLIASTQDWYDSLTYNVIKTVADVVIAEGGWHVLKGVVNGKNASSSAYDIRLTKYWLAQASD